MPTYELSLVLRQMSRVIRCSQNQSKFITSNHKKKKCNSYSPKLLPPWNARPRRYSTTAASFANWRISAPVLCRTRSANTAWSIGPAATFPFTLMLPRICCTKSRRNTAATSTSSVGIFSSWSRRFPLSVRLARSICRRPIAKRSSKWWRRPSEAKNRNTIRRVDWIIIRSRSKRRQDV